MQSIVADSSSSGTPFGPIVGQMPGASLDGAATRDEEGQRPAKYPRHGYEITPFNLTDSFVPPLSGKLPEHAMLAEDNTFTTAIAFNDRRHMGEFQALLYLLRNRVGKVRPIYFINEHGLGSDVHGKWAVSYNGQIVVVDVEGFHCCGQRGCRHWPKSVVVELQLSGTRRLVNADGSYPSQWVYFTCTLLKYPRGADAIGQQHIYGWGWCCSTLHY